MAKTSPHSNCVHMWLPCNPIPGCLCVMFAFPVQFLNPAIISNLMASQFQVSKASRLMFSVNSCALRAFHVVVDPYEAGCSLGSTSG
jgi:hypothetical protein